MRKYFAVTAVLTLMSLGIVAQANVFNLGSGLTNLETVIIGDAGNTGELSGPGVPGGYGTDRVCGAVDYSYRIGKYEITAAQYTDFLNNKAKTDPYELYNTQMENNLYSSTGCNIKRRGSGTLSDPFIYSVPSNWANRPVNYVSYLDTLRFANWMHNGQGNGSTETGAYTLNGTMNGDSATIQRNAGAKWFLTNEDEWYKAAYYKGGGTDKGYYDYATKSDSMPGHQLPDLGNNANIYPYEGGTIGNPYFITNVGEYINSPSAYGTFDQTGNLSEWNESLIQDFNNYYSRGLRGGSFSLYDNCGLGLNAMNRIGTYSGGEQAYIGFRVATTVPEPSSIITLAGGLGALLALRRRKA